MHIPGVIAAGTAQELLSIFGRSKATCLAINAYVGISRDMLDGEGETVPLATFTSMLEVAAHEVRRPTLGLELSKDFRWSALGPFSDLVQTAPTLGSALQKFTRHFGSVQTSTRTSLSIQDGRASLSYLVSDPSVYCRVQDAEFSIGFLAKILRRLGGLSWSTMQVDFAHPVGGSLDLYRNDLPCPIRFECSENAIRFPAVLLETILSTKDELAHARIDAELSNGERARSLKSDLATCVGNWITASLSQSGGTGIDHVAREFGLSTRSLQRSLHEQGMNYAAIRNKVRCTIAKSMLTETALPIVEIAYRLGYSETSAFSRGFKSETGQRPASFRSGRSLAA